MIERLEPPPDPLRALREAGFEHGADAGAGGVECVEAFE